MIKTISKILALTVLATAALSCSKAFLDGEESNLDGNLKIIVSGAASDVVSNTPLTGIKVTFAAYPADNTISILPLTTKTVYTDGNGIYRVEVMGFSENITCTLTAESTEQNETGYETLSNRLHVTWNGNSFDQSKNTFIVNDCNFQMKPTK